MEAEIVGRLLWLIVGTILGLLAYFLKKTDTKVDENQREVNRIKKDYATKDDLKDIQTEMGENQKEVNYIKQDYATKGDLRSAKTELETHFKEQNSEVMKKLEKIEDKIATINDKNVSKEDFIVANSRIEDKIQRITDILLDMGSCGK